MARQIAPVCRLCRREGEKLFLKGDKCYSDKCPVEKRPYAPGQHGRERKKMSDYALHLREKQKLRRIYGVLERSSAATITMRPGRRASPGKCCCSPWRCASTTFFTGSGLPRPGLRPGSWSPTATL